MNKKKPAPKKPLTAEQLVAGLRGNKGRIPTKGIKAVVNRKTGIHDW